MRRGPDGGRRAELAFVRFIGEGQLKDPYGLAARSVGGARSRI